MEKNYLHDIAEMRLLSERMNNHYSLSEIEERRKELICEMAFARKEFKDYLMNQTTAIISHYSLIKYATLTNSHQTLVNHWKGELKDKIVDFQEMDTKPTSGKRDMVFRALTERWEKDMELNTHPEYVIRRMGEKFKEEGIVLTTEMQHSLSTAFIADMPNIIKEMSYGNEETTESFVSQI